MFGPGYLKLAHSKAYKHFSDDKPFWHAFLQATKSSAAATSVHSVHLGEAEKSRLWQFCL